MARYRGPTCKLARREGTDLFLKSPLRPIDSKCKFDRPPGFKAGSRRPRVTVYGTQLREKQKLRNMYGLMEKQFRSYYARADQAKGSTGENLLTLLECRLDNVVFRLGFANSRRQARQLVKHKHFLVNDKPVNIPSYLVDIGDVVQVCERSRESAIIQEAIEYMQQKGTPEWLELDTNKPAGVIRGYPNVEQVAANVQTQLIIELYSK